jgi:hypothetical protein
MKFAKRRSDTDALGLYGPFIPLVLGCFATVPYLLFEIGIIPHDMALSTGFNFFMFYGILSHSEVVVSVFRDFEHNITLDGALYLYLIFYYIRLVKRTRTLHAQ